MYDKERILSQFQSATKGLDYDQGVVLGSIVGNLLMEVDILRTEVNDKCEEIKLWEERLRLAIQISKRKGEEIEHLRKVLEEIAHVLNYDSDGASIAYDIARQALEEKV